MKYPIGTVVIIKTDASMTPTFDGKVGVVARGGFDELHGRDYGGNVRYCTFVKFPRPVLMPVSNSYVSQLWLGDKIVFKLSDPNQPEVRDVLAREH